MSHISLYFQVHQPRRLRRFQAFDIGQNVDYFADYEDGASVNNPEVMRELSRKSYLPANKMMLEMLKNFPEMRVNYVISGSFLELLENSSPALLESFRDLVATKQVELIGETYYHSLAGEFDIREFKDQVHLHREKLHILFKVEPRVFKNTHLEFTPEIAEAVADLGYKAVLIDGATDLLGESSSNHVYKMQHTRLPLLVKNTQLSEDIAERFSMQEWDSYPLTADKFTYWLDLMSEEAEVVNLFLDYEAFGYKHSKESGIFEFMQALPAQVLSRPAHRFSSATDVLRQTKALQLHIQGESPVVRNSKARSHMLENDMQKDSLQKLYDLKDRVLATGNQQLIDAWRHLQSTDHFNFMATNKTKEAQANSFSPYDSPYTAFLSFMNILQDLELQVTEAEGQLTPNFS